MSYSRIKHLSCNPTMERQVRLVPNVTYSTATGKELSLTMILPWSLDDERIEKRKRPLIVYVQGSAWTTPDREYQILQLAEFAKDGYIVASVSHRSALDGNAFPAFLQDVKCAIRYLRKNAEKYEIDEKRVAIWGTSSGGNTALLVGLTGDWTMYKTEEYNEYSDSVNAVVECFGPTDLAAMSSMAGEDEYAISDIGYIMNGLCGNDPSKADSTMHAMSPIFYIENGANSTPFLLFHGDRDPIVPVTQMTSMYNKMLDCGYDVEAWQIDGAEHEGTFWSDGVYRVVKKFLEKI